MANFCAKCGGPLENGRCPHCDPAPQSGFAPAAPAENGFASILPAFQDLFASGDIMRILPAVGYLLLALSYLACLLLSVSAGAWAWLYDLNTWLAFFGCIGAAVAFLPLWKSKKRGGLDLLLLGSSGLFVLTVLGQLLNLLGFFSSGLAFIQPAMVLTLFGFWQADPDPFRRRTSLYGLCAMGAGLLLPSFGYSDVISLLYYLCTLFASVCLAYSCTHPREA